MTITTYTDREIALKSDLEECRKSNSIASKAFDFLERERDEYQQAADKMAMEHKIERDTLRQQLAEAQALIDASRKQKAVLYQRRMKPDYGPSWSEWDDCSEATFKQCLTVPKLHDWTHEARALFAAPVVADDLQSGVSGFGDSPAEAAWDFDKSWNTKITGGAND